MFKSPDKVSIARILCVAIVSYIASFLSVYGTAFSYSVEPISNFEVVKIFPGAEGFGTDSVGGRGGELCFVDSLLDSGEGTLRDCVEEEGPRIVLFRISGVIEVDTSITISDPFISIYGHSAPGGGVVIKSSLNSSDSPMVIESHDVLLQHLRLRAGSSTEQTCCRDALRIGNEKKGKVFNVVLDHLSLSWGTDQIANTWFDTNNVTFSYNLIAESLHDNGSNDEGPAGRGLLIGSKGSHSFSLHHNVIAHSYQRNPLLVTDGVVDVVNNLVYHWVSRGGEQRSTYPNQKVNWVKNRYIPRTESMFRKDVNQPSAIGWGDVLLSEDKFPMEKSAYFEGNLGHNRRWRWQKEWKLANSGSNQNYDPELGYHSDERFEAPKVTEIPASKLIEELLPIVGATLPLQDETDVRIIQQIKDRNGIMPNCVGQDDLSGDPRCDLNVGGWPEIKAGEPYVDTDRDGIPDEWEVRVGLDPLQTDSHLDFNNDGYTNLEDWLFDKK